MRIGSKKFETIFLKQKRVKSPEDSKTRNKAKEYYKQNFSCMKF